MSQLIQSPPSASLPSGKGGTFWQRLMHGVCRGWPRADWCLAVGSDWPGFFMQAEVTDDFHAKQGRSTGRWCFEAAGRPRSIYLKRHYRLPWWQGLGALLWPGGDWSPGMQECRNLEWALAEGLAVPEVVAAAEFIGPAGRLQSFLAIEELTGMLPLHLAIPLAARSLAPEVFRVWKVGLTREIARIARFLHDRSAFHKDLYLCHFFIDRADTSRIVPFAGRVFLIDFHRLGKHPYTKLFWQSKDLAQLLYSSAIEGIDDRDRVRFWREYLGEARRSRWGRWLLRLVLMRGRRYRDHNAKRKRLVDSE
jgi:heptose I phosphotransferase